MDPIWLEIYIIRPFIIILIIGLNITMVISLFIVIRGLFTKKHNTNRACIIFIISFILMLFYSFMYTGDSSVKSKIMNLYISGVKDLTHNRFSDGINNFRRFEIYSKKIYGNYPYSDTPASYYYIGDAAHILTSLDDKITKVEVNGKASHNSELLLLSYMFKAWGPEQINVQVISNDTILISVLSAIGEDITKLIILDDERQNIELKAEILESLKREYIICLIYRDYKMVNTFKEIIINDKVLRETQIKAVDSVSFRPEQIEYFSIYLNGVKRNSYYCYDSDVSLQWPGLRNEVAKAVVQVLENGEIIGVETYLEYLEKVEHDYNYKALNGHDWARYFLTVLVK